MKESKRQRDHTTNAPAKHPLSFLFWNRERDDDGGASFQLHRHSHLLALTSVDHKLSFMSGWLFYTGCGKKRKRAEFSKSPLAYSARKRRLAAAKRS